MVCIGGQGSHWTLSSRGSGRDVVVSSRGVGATGVGVNGCCASI